MLPLSGYFITFQQLYDSRGSCRQIGRQTGHQLADLAYLAEGDCPNSFSSPVRQQEYAYFIRKKQELETGLAQAEKEYLRNKTLFEKKVISEEEYDSYYFKSLLSRKSG